MFPFDLFKKKPSGQQNAVVEAFGRVKDDMTNMIFWINFFRDKDLKNDFSHEQINYVLGQHDGVIEGLKSEINELKMAVKEAKVSPFPDPDRTKSEPKYRNSFEKKLIAQARPNKKDFILQKITDLANKKSHTTKQIEEIIVEERGYCGRTTFYDYLRELKVKNIVKTTQIGSKKVLIETRF